MLQRVRRCQRATAAARSPSAERRIEHAPHAKLCCTRKNCLEKIYFLTRRSLPFRLRLATIFSNDVCATLHVVRFIKPSKLVIRGKNAWARTPTALPKTKMIRIFGARPNCLGLRACDVAANENGQDVARSLRSCVPCAAQRVNRALQTRDRHKRSLPHLAHASLMVRSAATAARLEP